MEVAEVDSRQILDENISLKERMRNSEATNEREKTEQERMYLQNMNDLDVDNVEIFNENNRLNGRIRDLEQRLEIAERNESSEEIESQIEQTEENIENIEQNIEELRGEHEELTERLSLPKKE